MRAERRGPTRISACSPASQRMQECISERTVMEHVRCVLSAHTLDPHDSRTRMLVALSAAGFGHQATYP